MHDDYNIRIVCTNLKLFLARYHITLSFQCTSNFLVAATKRRVEPFSSLSHAHTIYTSQTDLHTPPTLPSPYLLNSHIKRQIWEVQLSTFLRASASSPPTKSLLFISSTARPPTFRANRTSSPPSTSVATIHGISMVSIC